MDGESVSTNFVSFARPKHLELATDPGISTMVTVDENNVFHVGVSADAPALWVWLELEGADARYSDNFFHLAPGRSGARHRHPRAADERPGVHRARCACTAWWIPTPPILNRHT